ncbi:uncharacterized GPI-anchored protein At4g28100 [Sesamum indicum]|uniref:Uncharacterized GPI-anchored protein At4g28100 n=1 Tax=Sesamum indicum TaxID=4182 RepID=A0A6I9UG06_SESIN|nr:uncharacterized GPI-anchored protein At4g28100 [Sesamum indicum]
MRTEEYFSMHYSLLLLFLLLLQSHGSLAGLLSEPAQPLKPPDYNTVPAFPVQTEAQTCRLDLSAELFGGVNAACGRKLDCVNSLQTSLTSRNIHIPQPNASCDAVLCFCGIRLHQITSLSCPAAFTITGNYRNATPTAAVRNLEHNCKNSSYAGCTKCLGALQKLKVEGKNGTKEKDDEGLSDRASKMLSRDCQLMGLTWLLARNKTAYIPTVSAVLRAIMYSAHPPHESTCSPDQENMPLAVDSLQFEKYDPSSASNIIPLLPLLILGFLFA